MKEIQNILTKALNFEFLTLQEGLTLYNEASTSELIFVENQAS